MPMPVTIWLARKVMLSHACSSAIGMTARTPTNKPMTGLPLANEAIAPANAPVSIMPSILMFSTPAFSLTSSPVAANINGMARRMLEPMKTAINSSVIVLPLCCDQSRTMIRPAAR